MTAAIEIPGDAGADGLTLRKRPVKDFLIYERVKGDGGIWLRRGKRNGPDAGSACEGWFAASGRRSRQTIHYVGLLEIPHTRPRRKTRRTLSDNEMWKHSHYLFIGAAPGVLPSGARGGKGKRALRFPRGTLSYSGAGATIEGPLRAHGPFSLRRLFAPRPPRVRAGAFGAILSA